jgi:O-antigen/teichoic acid export membrane protein
LKFRTTHILRLTVILIALPVIATLLFALPVALRSDNTGLYRPIVLGLYVTAIPFFIALERAFRLLGYVDRNEAFSNLSVQALRTIKRCAIAISAAFAAGLPYAYFVADQDDAPGVMGIAMVVVFAAAVIATFAALLQKIMQDAIDIKSENDLTV